MAKFSKKTLFFIYLPLFFIGAMVGSGCSTRTNQGSNSANQEHCQTNWIPYTNKEANFAAMFPNSPVQTEREFLISKKQKKIAYQEVSTAAKGNTRYSIGFIKIPNKWKIVGSQTILKAVFEEILLSNPSLAVVEKDISSFHDHQALFFSCTDGNKLTKGCLVLVDNTLYEVKMEMPQGKSLENQWLIFLEAITIGLPASTIAVD